MKCQKRQPWSGISVDSDNEITVSPSSSLTALNDTMSLDNSSHEDSIIPSEVASQQPASPTTSHTPLQLPSMISILYVQENRSQAHMDYMFQRQTLKGVTGLIFPFKMPISLLCVSLFY